MFSTSDLSSQQVSTLADFRGLRVLALESRMASPTQRLIEKYHGIAQVAPSLREIPLENNTVAFEFFEKLRSGQFDYFILMTGVGLRTLLKVFELRFSKEEILEAFQKTQVVVRGPKPTSVCKINQIPIAITVPPPNTWQEILQTLTEEYSLQNKKVALLEYGKRDENFIEELQGRGAQVFAFSVYQWDLPEDTGPLRQAFCDVIANKIDLLLETSAVQIDHLLRMAKDVWEELKFRRALARVGIISIGPTTSAHLEERQIFPDLEVFPNKLENLVEQAAQYGPEILRRKRARSTQSWVRIDAPPPEAPQDSPRTELNNLLINSTMLRACRREHVDRIPVWLMRQAGRYMAEYQLIRRGKNFLDFCKDPTLCTDATLTAVERLNVDAAIIFSDILLILEPMGVPLAFHENLGPLISTPLRSLEEIEKLKPVDPESSLGFTLQAIREVRRQMNPRIPLIGFCGAPFTLASYMIEGKGSRNYIPTKVLMHSEPEAWALLMQKLTDALIDYLHAQVKAGCQILQVFDSWVGALSPEEYRRFVMPSMQRLFSSLPKEIPTIHFGVGTATLLDLQKKVGGNVIGLDWRMEISKTWDSLGDVAIQGNFDPVLLFSSLKVIREEAARILKQVGDKPGFIFNLGHGILPETPVDHVMALVDFVHEWNEAHPTLD